MATVSDLQRIVYSGNPQADALLDNPSPWNFFPDGRKVQGLRELQQVLAADELQLRRAMALKFFILAFGRESTDADEPLLDQLSRNPTGLRQMLWQLVNSDAFQKHGSR